MSNVGGARWLLAGSRRSRAMVALAFAVAVALGVLAQGTGDPVQAATLPALPAYFSVTGGGRVIPRSFFGLSTEYGQLLGYEKAGPVFDRVISLVKPQDGGRMLLRIGGKSADHTYWLTTPRKPPHVMIPLDHKWMTQLVGLVQRNNLRVMLDLNLAVHSPTMEATFARAAEKALPRSRLAGLEIGNEPDLYWRQPWLAQGRIPTTTPSITRRWPINYAPSDYRRDYSSYARVLRARLPHVALGGPEIISSKTPWLDAIERLGRLDPQFLTIHRYASSNCWPKTSKWYPSIPQMLNESASAGLANTVRDAVAFAHARHQDLRLTEVNSISCGGNPGVANTFAIALWAPDALFEMIRAGVDSVSWHIRPGQLNAPFQLTRRGIAPLPELYGLAVFAQMTRPGAELMNSALSQSSGLHVKGWAVRVPGGMRVLLINKGSRAADFTLRLGTPASTAYVRHLEAPSVTARGGVTFGGQLIGSDARWTGHLQTSTIAGSGGVFRVDLPAYSASLISAWHS